MKCSILRFPNMIFLIPTEIAKVRGGIIHWKIIHFLLFSIPQRLFLFCIQVENDLFNSLRALIINHLLLGLGFCNWFRYTNESLTLLPVSNTLYVSLKSCLRCVILNRISPWSLPYYFKHLLLFSFSLWNHLDETLQHTLYTSFGVSN